ncbi:hypothetical protein JAAARDRAFT_54792 [Jaapia argillacea MUCL 33604]|uniref:ATP-dependent DNA helicase PIF1 n=1 Tax=Jaapia argillacea MUCL 33604 TaxID=933084 RepID=A0A067Q5M5_9AGAM|nr:hypothetical protein JAAARDRAFT_54792 [Jaapia argillacea MUCL 33604]
MTPPSKAPMSGLRTVKRDYSEPTPSQDSASEIPWDPTPPKPLTGIEKRLRDIQDAIESKITSSERLLKKSPMLTLPKSTPTSMINSAPASTSHSFPNSNKRPFSSQQPGPSSSAPPPAKRRQLPETWDLLSSRTDFSEEPPFHSNHASTSGSGSRSNPISIGGTTTSAKAASKPAPVFLSKEQTHILGLVNDGMSLFYTGSAGTGKSVLLREIIKTLKKKFIKIPDAVAITASTGIAACNIGGVTIHSFAGIGLGIESAEDLTMKIRKNKKASARWLRTKVLIIDEVSMVDGDLFDKLARIGSLLRKRPEPFGGIQLVVTGDFFQLPPVTKGNVQVKFAFEATRWNECVQKTFNLTKVFRQTDQTFVDMLNEMRFGRLSANSIARFRALSREVEYDDGLGPTELFPRREDVDRSNTTRLSRLPTQSQTFFASDTGQIEGPQREKMLANFMAPSQLTLRVDSQVMLIKNVDETLVNGSMGKVVRFVDPATYGTESDMDGEVDEIGGGDGKGGKAGSGGKVEKKPAGSGKLLPIVDFVIPGRRETRRVLVTPESWKVELPNGDVQVARSQLPLILAWAMSIHKSQGQTLERVKVDLGKVFEKGQAYVALSRATSLEGLQVLNFDPKKVTVHPKVVEWSKTLETITE